ncbi:MAG TPA: MGMT family protein [Methanocella sp.]|uniref:methylated-DNA--[protein]-cysteine S-methyltransferase n=1 Tax=Methanocella sp. TaxID=2052833 RepID=UPI002C7EA80A|nr:MGMT family protein [Methanocella sp.]HTY90360.1 MGMT family protein [Methanocella sp.]
MKDYLYSDYLGLYVTVEFEGNTIKSLEMTSKKPGFKPTGSKVIRSLAAYFKNGKGDFSGYELGLEGMTPFQRSVLQTIFKIPAGETMTYAEVAEAAGKPGAARAVGNVMACNPIPLILPCHRVVASNGLGGFTGGLEVKRKLLKLEGAL